MKFPYCLRQLSQVSSICSLKHPNWYTFLPLWVFSPLKWTDFFYWSGDQTPQFSWDNPRLYLLSQNNLEIPQPGCQMVSTDILDTHLYVWVFFFSVFSWTESSKIGLPSPNPDTWQSQCNFYQKLTVSSLVSRNTNSHTRSILFMLQPAPKFPGQIPFLELLLKGEKF